MLGRYGYFDENTLRAKHHEIAMPLNSYLLSHYKLNHDIVSVHLKKKKFLAEICNTLRRDLSRVNLHNLNVNEC